MKLFPLSWYIYFPKFSILESNKFAAEWREISLLSSVPKHTNRGDRNSMQEHHYHQFYTNTGKGNDCYSGMINAALVIPTESASKKFIDFTNALMQNAPSHECSRSKHNRCLKHTIPSACYNTVVKNYYRPNDWKRAHKDDEPSLVMGTPIFSFTHGGSREFRLSKHSEIHVKNTRNLTGSDRNGSQRPIQMTLNDGDLLVMGGHMGQTQTHDIRKVEENGELVENRIDWIIRAFDPKHC